MSAEYEVHHGTLYDYNAGCQVGVLIKENVMRKLLKLQHQHLDAVKRLLTDEAENGNVFPSMWTLHYPEGKQTTVRFIDKSENLAMRIKSAVCAAQPRVEKLVFIASSMDEAERMANAHHAATADATCSATPLNHVWKLEPRT